jgi:hypothetical protein
MLVPARDTEGLRARRVFLDAYRTFATSTTRGSPCRAAPGASLYPHAAWIAMRWDDPPSRGLPHFGT